MAEILSRRRQNGDIDTLIDATDPIPVVSGSATSGLEFVQYEDTVASGDGDKEISFTGNSHGFMLYHHATVTTIQVSIDGGTTWSKLGSHGSTGDLFRVPGGYTVGTVLTSIHVKSGAAAATAVYIVSYEEV